MILSGRSSYTVQAPHIERRPAFTLVELLVVLSLFLILASIALPVFKKLLSDQKASKAARSIVSYIDEARSRAIAQGRSYGVRIERQNFNSSLIELDTATSLRVRQLVGIPPYTGEAADAVVMINDGMGSPPTVPVLVPPHFPPGSTTVVRLTFELQDNQLLSLADQGANAPLRTNDIIELPGGRQFMMKSFFRTTPSTSPSTPTERMHTFIDLNNPVNYAYSYPEGAKSLATVAYHYKIHRSPVVSSSAPLTFARGVAIDLNYSGFGDRGNSFAPINASINQAIDIVFGPDGRVESVSRDSTGLRISPPGLIYLCVGNTDGVRVGPLIADLVAPERRSIANLMNPESIWIIINPVTGRIVTAPFATVTDTTSIGNAIVQARSLARLADTLDAQP